MTSDILKVVGLLGVIGMIAFDIMNVRSKDRTLQQTLASQVTEMESLRKSATESKAYYERSLEDADQRCAKAKAKEEELTRKIASIENEHRKELEEQKKELEEQKKREAELQSSFSEKIQEMKERFAQERIRVQSERDANARAQVKKVMKEEAEVEEDVESKGASVEELKRQIAANKEEIAKLRKENPGCILVDSRKQVRILETKFRPRGFAKYCLKGQITYVRDVFHCTACDSDLVYSDMPCCRVSRQRSFNAWKKSVHDAEETTRINERIDELTRENEELENALPKKR